MRIGIRNIASHIVDAFRLDFLTSSFEPLSRINALLDLGCGEKPFRGLYAEKVIYTVGTDVPYSPHSQNFVDVFSDGQHLPFTANTFDVVLCSEVMEHIPEPDLFLAEINRILTVDGLLILTTPLLVPEHEEPYDFYRYTRYGLTYLLEKNGFSVNKIEPFGELAGVLLSFIIQIQMKIWNVLGKAINWNHLSSIYNPFVFFFVYLPQVAYMALINNIRKSSMGEKIYQRYSYTTKGFGILASKNAN